MGIHRTTKFTRMFQMNNLTEQFYYNKCACNEFAAITKRHALGPIKGFNHNNQELKSLRSEVENCSKALSALVKGRCTHQTLVNNTRPALRGRYINAHKNIVNNRIIIDDHYSKLSTFIKYEKAAIEKKEKPARLIQFRSYEYLYSLKSYVLDHTLTIKENPDIAWNGQKISEILTKYHNQVGCADVLRRSWDEFANPVAVCMDHSKFDGHYGPELLEIEHMYWNTLYKSKFLKYLLSKQFNNRGRTQNGLRYKMRGHRCSGEYTTSEGNSLINYAMIVCFVKHCGITKFRIHVNGDDSVLIIDQSELHKLRSVEFFRNFNMETEIDKIAYNFEAISYCQCSPIRINGQYKMTKEPWRAMSRAAYCDSKYFKCLNRFLAGSALCDLLSYQGVPVLQSFFLMLIRLTNLSRPLGSVDKRPSQYSGYDKISIIPVDETTREDFSVAFGMEPSEQINMEKYFDGLYQQTEESVSDYINKYKFFSFH